MLRLADVQIVPQYCTRRRSRAHTTRTTRTAWLAYEQCGRQRGNVLELVGVGQSVNASNTRREHGVEGDITDCTANNMSAEKETPGQLILAR